VLCVFIVEEFTERGKMRDIFSKLKNVISPKPDPKDAAITFIRYNENPAGKDFKLLDKADLSSRRIFTVTDSPDSEQKSYSLLESKLNDRNKPGAPVNVKMFTRDVSPKLKPVASSRSSNLKNKSATLPPKLSPLSIPATPYDALDFATATRFGTSDEILFNNIEPFTTRNSSRNPKLHDSPESDRKDLDLRASLRRLANSDMRRTLSRRRSSRKSRSKSACKSRRKSKEEDHYVSNGHTGPQSSTSSSSFSSSNKSSSVSSSSASQYEKENFYKGSSSCKLHAERVPTPAHGGKAGVSPLTEQGKAKSAYCLYHVKNLEVS